MTAEPGTTTHLVNELVSMPVRLMMLFIGTDYDRLAARPSAEAWSPLEILAHIRASDDILSPRIVQVLVRDEPTLLAFDERRWAAVMDYAESEVELLLDGLDMRRKELDRVLRPLPDAAWARVGHHEAIGPVSVRDLVEKVVAHDAEHLTELRAMLERSV